MINSEQKIKMLSNQSCLRSFVLKLAHSFWEYICRIIICLHQTKSLLYKGIYAKICCKSINYKGGEIVHMSKLMQC